MSFTVKTKLVDTGTGKEVAIGARVRSFRGEMATVTDFEPPAHPGSTGRVYVTVDGFTGEQGFYPKVFGLSIVSE